MSSTEDKETRLPTFIYPAVVTACIVHALAFGISPWCGIWDISHGFGLFVGLLLTWPFWIFPLWWCREGRKSRVITPLVVGFVALLPGLFIWYVMANFNPG